MVTPTLILPRQGGGKFFRELDAPQLCCGVLHYREGIEEIINLQPLRDGKAKAYQVKQVRGIIFNYKLHKGV
jgi:hypothetical protein